MDCSNDHNTVYHCTWAPRIWLCDRRINKLRIDDRKRTLLERCITCVQHSHRHVGVFFDLIPRSYDGAHALSELSSTISAGVSAQLQQQVPSLALTRV